MTTVSTPGTKSRCRRWLLLGAAVVGLLLLTAFLVVNYSRPRTVQSVEPPQPNLTGVDPAVQRVIEKGIAYVKKEPQSGAAWGQLGCIFTAHLFSEEAYVCFGEAERYEPDNPMWAYLQGLTFLPREPEKALPKIEQAVKLVGDSVEGPRLQLAELYMSLGRNEEARAQFQAALKQQKWNARAQIGLARIALQAGNLDAAQKLLEEAGESEYGRKAILAIWAEILERKKDTKGAQQKLAKMIELPDDPAWPDPYRETVAKYQVGESVRLRATYELNDSFGRPQQALLYAEQLVTDYPQSPRAWAALGWVQLNQLKYEAADQSSRKSLALDDKNAEVWANLGQIRYEQKRFEDAVSFFHSALERKPNLWRAHYQLGMCWQKLGRPKEAITAFYDALGCQPLSPPSHARLGELLLKEKRTNEAIQHLQQAVDLDPKDAATRQLLDDAKRQH
jgi:tetratricopeptide (TPR) repeat protein